MKKTARKHLLRSVRIDLSSWLIVALVACAGIAVFHGLRSASVALEEYFRLNSFPSPGDGTQTPLLAAGTSYNLSTIGAMLRKFSVVLAIPFLLVSAAVCYAVSSRRMEEQRATFGGQKAMGLTAKELLQPVLIANLCGALTAIVPGWLLGLAVEGVALRSLAPILAVPVRFSTASALVSGAVWLAVQLGIAYISATGVLGESTKTLLERRKGHPGLRRLSGVSGFSRKLSAHSRAVLRGLESDRSRMLSAVLGTLGCTALMVFCLTMIRDIPVIHLSAENSDAIRGVRTYLPVLDVCQWLAAALLAVALTTQLCGQLSRKEGELLLLRRSGASVRRTKAYLYKENAVLTLAGTVLGCGAGMLLAALAIRSMDSESCRIVWEPDGIACLITCGVCALLAVLVNVLVLRRVDRMSLRLRTDE